MTERDRVALKKICGYIRDTLSFIEDVDFEGFMQDKKTISAVAFSVGQVGELVREVSDEAQTKNPQISWKNIRGMRNRIIHDYENVDLVILWRTITTNLPELLAMLEGVLKEDATQDVSPEERSS